MKNICTINTELATVEDHVDYRSNTSLLDYDIILFDPELPYCSRIDFSGGGSCITIEGGQSLIRAMDHWSREFTDALSAGKTIFVILNNEETDSVAVSVSSPRKGSHNYSTNTVNNYSVLPFKLNLRNAKGRRFKAAQSEFKGMYEAIKEVSEYRVLFSSKFGKPAFTTNDGNGVVGSILSSEKNPGHIVLLPYFDTSNMVEEVDDEEVWSAKAIQISKAVISQLVAIDKYLKLNVEGTPKPSWVKSFEVPVEVEAINKKIEHIEKEISGLQIQKGEEVAKRIKLQKFDALLYENGKPLEITIEDSLKLFGYEVENYVDGDVEIDHVLVGPNGFRMIGESEGKDSSAIGISKFRQLESNINEDFAKDEVEIPAKGILFGNGYRFKAPEERDAQFTKKCFVNAERLGTALVQTDDLYRVVLHILNNPTDTKLKESCREAIETTKGGIVKFPKTE